MYIFTVPNRKSPPAILLCESDRQNGKVKTRTIANLTHWAPQRLEALRKAFSGEFDGMNGEEVSGEIFGVLFALKQLADQVGMTRVLGKSEEGRLALFLVLARIAHGGSRRSAVRWAEQHAVSDILGLEEFDENDLYRALDWLEAEQKRIERQLYEPYVKRSGKPPAIVLYDVTSSYFEGEQNELADYGYNRDGKKGKKPMVIGLLTGADGEPLAVRVFEGNTADPTTVGSQIELLKQRFGVSEVVFIGDRGMIKTQSQDALGAQGWRYISAITKPQIRALIDRGVLQPDLFDEDLSEVEQYGNRLIIRRHVSVQHREQARRADKLQRLAELITVDERYRDLQKVERNFRTIKTDFLEIRPIFLRHARRTKAHVFVAMLALKITRLFDLLLHQAFGTTDGDPNTITHVDARQSLARLTYLISDVNGTGYARLVQPDDRQRTLLDALGIHFPKQAAKAV
jgi:hypothetical protein